MQLQTNLIGSEELMDMLCFNQYNFVSDFLFLTCALIVFVYCIERTVEGYKTREVLASVEEESIFLDSHAILKESTRT